MSANLYSSEQEPTGKSRWSVVKRWLLIVPLLPLACAATLLVLLAYFAIVAGSLPGGIAVTVGVVIGVFVASRLSSGSWYRATMALFLTLVASALLVIIGVGFSSWLIPNFWVALLLTGIVAAALFWLIGKVALGNWMPLLGVFLVVGPFVVAGISPQDANPAAKPTPENRQVDYWDLDTGSRLGYVRYDAEASTKAPIIFVHGGPGGGATPSDFEYAEVLASEGYETYVYDQAGVGYSDDIPIDDYNVQRMIDDLEAIRTEIGAEQINLIGHSWGGALVARYLTQHGDRVESAVLQSPRSFTERSAKEDPNLTASDTPGSLGALETTLRSRLALFAASEYEDASPEFLDGLMSQDQFKEFFHERFDGLDGGSQCAGLANPNEEIPEMLRAANFNLYANTLISGDLDGLDPDDGLSEIDTPVLITRGVCDYNQWVDQRAYRDKIPGAQLASIPDEGHARGDAAVAAAISFLNDGNPGVELYTSDDRPERN